MKLFLSLIIITLQTAMAQNIKIDYLLQMPEPSTHYFEVGITFENLPKTDKTLSLILPVWRPGRYLIFDFASGIQEFSAYNSTGKKLEWKKTDKTTWLIQKKGQTKVSVKYRVFANEFANRTRGLDEMHGFVNGTAVFMYSPRYRNLPVNLKVEPYGSWHVTTGLESVKNNSLRFTAPSYDYLSDCPLEIGTQNDFDFDIEGRKHIISFFGDANYDKEKLINDFTAIIRKNYEFWGSVPYEKYVFIVHCTPSSGGGTEHINSTVVGVRPEAFNTAAGYESFLKLISHEFFHTWNVKQLKPKGITPYDFTKENYTSELWIAEGGTSYYDGLMLVRTGQMKVEDFYGEITRGIEDERRRPGNRIQSVAESSFDAWVKFWRRTPNAYESESDYYAKGSYVCLVLDLDIRNSSKNKYSLDDVFKAMFNRFPLDKKGYDNDDFRRVSEEFAGKNLGKFFDDYVTGSKPIDWERYLSYAGLELGSNESTYTPVVGLVTSKKGDKIVIDDVIAGSSSEKAGLLQGDEIIAYNGLRLNYEYMERRIKELVSGDSVKLTIFRTDKLMEFTLILQERKLANYSLEKAAKPTVMQKAIYEKWLEAKW
jgi:predicted metalloprotease with PDZ domain